MERRRVTNMETVASEMKKTAELIELPFGMVSGVGPRNRVLCGHAHWRHLADTVERLCTAWRIRVGLPRCVATRPIPKLLCDFLFLFVHRNFDSDLTIAVKSYCPEDYKTAW